MDLLCDAYSNTSDDDDDDKGEQPKRQRLSISSSNPPKPHLSSPSSSLFNFQTQAPIPGSYVSKRQRASLGPKPTSLPDPNPLPSSFTLTGSISDADIPRSILSLLKNKAQGHQNLNSIPEKLSASLYGHTKAVNAIHWSSSHVKDVKWSQQGLFLLSCGYDCTSRLVDVEKGLETQVLREEQIVGVIKFHPDNSNLFLSGGSKGRIKLWDIRTGKVVHNYNRNLGPILDVEFTTNGKQFISSSDVSGSNLSENSIIVWDVSRQIPLSNQVYVEAYTCPCVRCHPFDSIFVSQSNGNYVAIFTTTPPYRLNKYKRYESHGVSGFPIKCNFSLDGKKLASGSSDGFIYIYDYQSSKVVKKIKAYDQACIDIAFHPVIPNVFASCSWDGSILVFE
ncbi:uncharacterized protein LOC133294960 isoform X2 [Gastrolobium bilobum]|uniref:uncharacterized protein LOC133294960 isoform X2 n=1 Tax=Gastrolobium bilobum TaxID=150636 RepID=UPI002AB278EA|nr:uncharacterized protein LOC133294960 isoform X2 [Gastrolobium bilobum]